MAFEAYGRPVVAVSEFNYLGRVLTRSDDDWTTVVGNLRKTRKQWAKISRILGKEGADSRPLGIFYKEVVEADLMFCAESWVVSPQIVRTQGGFHHKVSRRL